MKRLFLPILLFPLIALAQPVADSLKNLLHDKSLSARERIDVLNELAYQNRRFNWNTSLAEANEVLALSERLGYKKGEAFASITLGSYHLTKSNYEKSIHYGLSALDVFEAIDDKTGLQRSYMLLGITYRQLKETSKAEEYLKKSLALCIDLRNNDEIVRAYNSLGLAAQDRKDYDEAFQRFLLGLKYLPQGNSHHKVNLLGSIGALHVVLGETDKALPYLDQARKICEEMEYKQGLGNIHFKLGLLYKSILETAKAEEHFLIAEKLLTQLNDKRYMLEVYKEFIEIKTITNRKDEAFDYQVKYNKVRDSLFNMDKAQQIIELVSRHESEKKEKAIRQLTEEKKIEAIWRKVLITGVLLSIIAAYFIYRLQRSRTKKANQLLEVQQLLNEKLKEVDKLKSGFFANISHEFRTPLTLILAPVENELKKRSSAEGKESLLLIRRSANRLLELVNQLLDLSRLESGKLDLRIRQANLKQLFSVLAASFDSLAEHKQIYFIKNINLEDKPYWFDQDKIEKIVTNLLANAFKYTPSEGTVTLTIRSADGHTVTIIVTDTGPGISKEEQANVFSPFYQIKQTDHQPATGLGLSLVRELVKLYNGTIALESNIGKGTVFTVVLPANHDAFNARQIVTDEGDIIMPLPITIEPKNSVKNNNTVLQRDELSLAKDSILVVEDNTDLKEFISTTLQNHDYTVISASDGKEALQHALKFVPNLILSDLMMPVMDGIELTKRIKDDERTSHIPVILLTAKNEQQSRIHGLRTGADDYLTKPFSPDELMVRIKNLIEQRKKLAEKFRERILVAPTPATEISLDDKFLHKIRAIVEANLADYTFTVEKMAVEIHLSRTQLLRKLKALTGLSPNDFIKDIRLKRAADMIRKKTDTITQIGYAVGFNDQSYFTKCFKKQFGVTPSDYSVSDFAATKVS